MGTGWLARPTIVPFFTDQYFMSVADQPDKSLPLKNVLSRRGCAKPVVSTIESSIARKANRWQFVDRKASLKNFGDNIRFLLV